MPVVGRKPKPEGQKRNRVKPVHDWTEVADVPFAGGPKLPRTRSQGRAWPARTKAWWAALSTMPHCVLWGPSDWQYAIDAALIAAELHEGDVRAAPALDRREKVMGTTVDFRRDLRIRYVDQAAEQGATDGTVTAIADYRQMIDGG